MNEINYNTIKNILILRLGKIGDMIISSFVFKTIKTFNPIIKIHLVTLKRNKELLRINPDIDEIYFVKQNVLAFLKLLPLKFRKNFDLVIDLNDNPSNTSALLLKFFDAKFKLGFNFDKQKKYLTHSVEQLNKESTHLVERYAYLLKTSGLEITDEITRPIIYLDKSIEERITSELSKLKQNHKLIGLNISSGAPIRKYNVENWIKLISSLTDKHKEIKILILFDSQDVKDAEHILNSFKGDLVIKTKCNTFQRFAATIKNLDLLITPDTSAVHVCSALQIPVIALYPNTKWSNVSFAPYKTIYKTITSKTEEIKDIPIQKIETAFEEIIKELRWK